MLADCMSSIKAHNVLYAFHYTLYMTTLKLQKFLGICYSRRISKIE